jgi:transcriptional regulator GlxA family with amidase domain
MIDEIAPIREGSMKIAVYAFDGTTMFHLSVPQLVFGEVSRQRLADWETVLFNEDGTDIHTMEGYRIGSISGLDAALRADLVVIASWHEDKRPPSASLAQALRTVHARGAAVAGLCLGAFPLADSGLLTSRSAVTHWQELDAFRERHPDITVDRTVLYIDHGDVLTSAGTAAAIDACLHLVRSRLGAEAANRVARWDGSQWHSLGEGSANGVNSTVRVLAVYGTDRLRDRGELRLRLAEQFS